jgi:hypothetical protein
MANTTSDTLSMQSCEVLGLAAESLKNWETNASSISAPIHSKSHSECTGSPCRGSLSNYSTFQNKEKGNLQSVSKELVHLGNLGGNGEIDRPVANLDNESTNNVLVNLVGNLELLALADVGGLGDGGLEAVEGLVVQRLKEMTS